MPWGVQKGAWILRGAGHSVLWVLWYVNLDRCNELLKPFMSVEQTCMTRSIFYSPLPLFEKNRGSLCFAVLQTCKVTGVRNSHSRVINQRQGSAAVLPFELSSWLDPGLGTTFSIYNSSGDAAKEFEVVAQKRTSNKYNLVKIS